MEGEEGRQRVLSEGGGGRVEVDGEGEEGEGFGCCLRWFCESVLKIQKK